MLPPPLPVLPPELLESDESSAAIIAATGLVVESVRFTPMPSVPYPEDEPSDDASGETDDESPRLMLIVIPLPLLFPWLFPFWLWLAPLA